MKILKPILRKRFKCEYCKHPTFYNEKRCLEHENKCYKNPNRNCPLCENTGRVDELMNNEHYGHKNRDCYSCEIAQKAGGKSYLKIVL